MRITSTGPVAQAEPATRLGTEPVLCQVCFWSMFLILRNFLFLHISKSCSFFQGYAYTFITEDQVRYAGDIIKALELSGSPVPIELEQLWASFKDQQKAVRQETGGSEVAMRVCVHQR